MSAQDAGPVTTAVAEAFQTHRIVDTLSQEPWVVAWTPGRSLQLLDLTSAWTTRSGGNQALCSGDRTVARRWARAIYEKLPNVDGLLWRSSVLGAGWSAALFDCADGSLPSHPDLHLRLSDPALGHALNRIASRLGYGLA